MTKRKLKNIKYNIQFAVVGQNWTPVFDVCLSNIEAPVVTITSHLEAALYSRIKPIVRVIPTELKIKKLLGNAILKYYVILSSILVSRKDV